MPAKKRDYGLWLITQSTGARAANKHKFLGVIETDSAGIDEWLSLHGYPKGKVGVNLLPEVEFFTPIKTNIPHFTAPKSTTKPKLVVRNPKKAQTYCAGSSRMTNATERRRGFAVCGVCKKSYSYNMNGRLRKHYA